MPGLLGQVIVTSIVYGSVDATIAPSFLSVLRKHLPEVTSDEGGLIMYCAIRPFYGRLPETKVKQLHPFESWIAFNRWPIPHSSETHTYWSGPIPVISNQWGPWAVRLLSMTFEQYNEDTEKYETIRGSTITFGDGLVVAIDLGSSVSWVPPVLVRHIRTKVFPTQYNLDRDAELKDSPSSLKQGPVYLVQGRIHTKRIKYEFVGADNDAVEVFGPVDQFICVEAHSRDVNTPIEEVVREGLLFVYDTKRWPDLNMAVFGLNFFQSMFLSFHQPVIHYGGPYVKMMPQWANKRALFKLPPA